MAEKEIKNGKKNGNKKDQNSRKNPRKFFKIIATILLISLIIFLTYRYIEEIKENAYIAGGKDAIKIIIDTANNEGGITIKNNEETVVLSKYHKPIDTKTSTTEPPLVTEDTDKIIENTNQTTE